VTFRAPAPPTGDRPVNGGGIGQETDAPLLIPTIYQPYTKLMLSLNINNYLTIRNSNAIPLTNSVVFHKMIGHIEVKTILFSKNNN